MIETIVILGAGNVAWHLLESFTLAGIQVLQVFGRNQQDADIFEAFGDTKYIYDIKGITPFADIYFICVNDDAIVEISRSLPFTLDGNQILVHTSGGQSSEILSSHAAHYGSFWPLQSLTKEAQILSNEIPIIITASDEFTTSALVLLADTISDNFTVMTDDKKQHLHLAAVLVNNFTNHLYTLTSEYCSDHGLDFYLLSSLIKETSMKAVGFDPSEIQTGPARRNDSSTIENHLSKLEGYPDLYKLYCLFTESIIHKHHKE